MHFSQSQQQNLTLENKKRSPEGNGKDGDIPKKQKLCTLEQKQHIKKVVDKSGASSKKPETAKKKVVNTQEDNIRLVINEFVNVMKIEIEFEKAVEALKATLLEQFKKDCANLTILQKRYLYVIIMYNIYMIFLCLFL